MTEADQNSSVGERFVRRLLAANIGASSISSSTELRGRIEVSTAAAARREGDDVRVRREGVGG